jgi:hypothetical protein
MMVYTRPNIAFTLRKLSQYLKDLVEYYISVLKNLIRYLRSIITYYLKYTSYGNPLLVIYSNID